MISEFTGDPELPDMGLLSRLAQEKGSPKASFKARERKQIRV